MKRIFGLLSLGGGAISGLLGVIGALGFCSAPWIVALFGLFGLNSMLLATYNKIFLILGLIFFGGAAIFLSISRKACSPRSEAGPEEKQANRPLVSLFLLVIVGVLLFSAGWFAGRQRFSPKTFPKTSSPTQDLAATDAYLKFKQIKASAIPSGVPPFYGEELRISFDQAQEAINTVSPLDPTYGSEEKKIILVGNDLERYKKIGSLIACEYCCGAKTLVFENGEAACGCDHSQMMRGLAAYLIQNYPDLTDEQILGELKDWKAVFFPQQTLAAKIGELEKAGEPGIKELLQEFPDFLPKMVGGC